MLWDGRYANNAWLQELPKSIINLTWDNAALISPRTAKRLGLEDEDVILLEVDGTSVAAPVLTVPGHPDDSTTVYLGHGRTRAGRVGNQVGFNAYPLQSSRSPFLRSEVRLRKTGKKHPLALTHTHWTMQGRDLVARGNFEQLKADATQIVPEELRKFQPSLMPEYPYPAEAWAMAIDQTACIGCKACTIACQAENNIPVVGKEQVRNSREMHWIRVDRYFEGSPENPSIYFQPVPCMHCEKAPCEEVCPTLATVHSSDGLNQMVYNRCVGTRYCSNNCPYKVRRFNFFQYTRPEEPLNKLRYNPDVTVRSRGVMEKCTYCIQRIQAVRIQAGNEDRPIRDQEIVPACQAACPTEAIMFGDQAVAGTRVSRWKASPLNYALLNDLGTQPRTTYLAVIRNPNPLLAAKQGET